jgi:hypothetical protein
MPNRDVLCEPGVTASSRRGELHLAPGNASLLDDLALILNRCADSGITVIPWCGILATQSAYLMCIKGRWVIRAMAPGVSSPMKGGAACVTR